MNGLSAQGLADLAGVSEAEVVRLVELGILAAREGAEPFLEVDVPKVRLATVCEQTGLPMEDHGGHRCGAARQGAGRRGDDPPPELAGAVLSALGLVAQLPEAGLPPARVGIVAGPVVAQGGGYFGRTVNLAARVAAHAGAGQVLISGSVAESAPPQGVRFVEAGEVRL